MENEEKPVMSESKSKTKLNFSQDALLLAVSIIVASLIVAAAMILPGKVMLKSGNALPSAGDAANPSAAAPTDTKAVTSLDDDPVLGDKKKAKVAIVEFSDYECPFCKKFHDETFDQLVKEYVDTGKAVISFRDFPLSFHDPMATDEAALAECVGKEKGDKAYFAFGKGLYAQTQANGKGLPAGKLDELIKSTGANVASVTACSKTDAVKQEIAKDMADGQAAGVSGTPSFVIGTLSSDGTVTGERVVGALPLSGFMDVFEKYLK